MSPYIELVIGFPYALSGMKPVKGDDPGQWGAPHPRFGMPQAIAGWYLGALQGTRRWHGFEIRHEGTEQGVIFMTDDDLETLTVSPIHL